MKATPSTSNPFPLPLAIFPLLELFFFVSSALVTNPFLSAALVLIAGIFLNFSIHVFFHECVHVKESYPNAINIIYSILMGLPFDGYRIHHYNHHNHENGLGDFSTTWFMQGGKQVGYAVCTYVIGWPRQLAAAMREPKPFEKNYGDAVKIKERIPPQKVAIILLFIALAIAGLKYLILYLVLIYSGWAFTALHNYGQHPPLSEKPICTYANKPYNYLFFNNGLHWEHHDKPWLSWDNLELDSKSDRIYHAHLINPCLGRREI